MTKIRATGTTKGGHKRAARLRSIKRLRDRSAADRDRVAALADLPPLPPLSPIEHVKFVHETSSDKLMDKQPP